MTVIFGVIKELMKFIFIILLLTPPIAFGKKTVTYFDRDGDQYREEKQTTYKRNHQVLKTITEIDTNSDKKYDREITTYFHYDRMKSYKINRYDKNFDGKWDRKEVEIKTITKIYSF